MKKTALSLMAFAALAVQGQKYEFQTVKDIPCEAVVSQGQTGTCWSFSSTSFLESEITRINGKHIDLSEMYNVRHNYPKKAWNYVMRQGHAQFGEGGLNHDVINSAMEFGIVPQSAYSGLVNDERSYNHEKMVGELEALLKSTVAEKKPDPKWKDQVNAILEKYMGHDVIEFTYEGKKYNPKTFLAMTRLDLKSYVTITSFCHQPYYSHFILDIPDNFSYGQFCNMPLDEFVANIDNALEKGFTVALDADVSEATFSAKNGVAVIPAVASDDQAAMTEIKPEMKVTPEYRQAEFENYDTTDDHLMHIVGKVKDQKGNIYYKVKNSWGNDSARVANGGFVYMSVPYVKLKAISVMVHKDALLPKTRKSLSL